CHIVGVGLAVTSHGGRDLLIVLRARIGCPSRWPLPLGRPVRLGGTSLCRRQGLARPGQPIGRPGRRGRAVRHGDQKLTETSPVRGSTPAGTPLSPPLIAAS